MLHFLHGPWMPIKTFIFVCSYDLSKAVSCINWTFKQFIYSMTSLMRYFLQQFVGKCRLISKASHLLLLIVVVSDLNNPKPKRRNSSCTICAPCQNRIGKNILLVTKYTLPFLKRIFSRHQRQFHTLKFPNGGYWCGNSRSVWFISYLRLFWDSSANNFPLHYGNLSCDLGWKEWRWEIYVPLTSLTSQSECNHQICYLYHCVLFFINVCRKTKPKLNAFACFSSLRMAS